MGSHLATIDLITNLEIDNRFCAYLIGKQRGEYVDKAECVKL